MSLRYFANAPATSLAASCTSLATTIELASVTALPITYPYTLIIDRGTSSEEVVSVTDASGTTLTVTRGADSTTSFEHAVGAEVVHGISAQDPREANTHVNATAGVHGTTGGLVGTSDTQSLTNKTLGGSNVINGFSASKFMQSDGTGRLAASTKDLPAGVVVGTTDTQTLTGKTISVDGNTLSGIAASSFVLSNGSGNIDGSAAQKAVPAGVVVGTTDALTLTNKALTAPAITGATTVGAGATLTAPTLTGATITNLTLDGDDLNGEWEDFTVSLNNWTAGIGATLEGRKREVGSHVEFTILLFTGLNTIASGAFSVDLPSPAFVIPTGMVSLAINGTATLYSASGPGTREYAFPVFAGDGGTVLNIRKADGTLITSTTHAYSGIGHVVYIAGSYEKAV